MPLSSCAGIKNPDPGPYHSLIAQYGTSVDIERGAADFSPSIGTVAPILKVRDLGKGPRDIESDNSHGDSSSWVFDALSRGARGLHDKLWIRARSATGQVAEAAS